jgi:hypothetical protein
MRSSSPESKLRQIPATSFPAHSCCGSFSEVLFGLIIVLTITLAAGLTTGSDTLTGVNDEDYKPTFPLTAKLNKLTIKVDRPKLTKEDITRLENAEATALDGKPLNRVQEGPP